FDGIDRPAWQTAGVRIVDDVTPYEQRKLWLLNGSHSLLAYLGLQLGHETVASAMEDPVCRAAVEQLWDEAALELPLPAAEITAARDA
ncbi:mannitol dehydrogenase family protein, partial [Bacillus sp. S34]|nr:mannitol dehydrogenase family protein [Bacillus sp. S34]